jgi:hypothetical protein
MIKNPEEFTSIARRPILESLWHILHKGKKLG